MARTADEGKKKRPRPTGSEGSAKSIKEDGKPPQDDMQDKSSQLHSKESPLVKKVRTDEQNVNKTPETSEKNEDKRTTITSAMHDSTASRKKPKNSPGVVDLKLFVESCGGKLEDGWQVEACRKAGGKLTKTYISPTLERFRSRVEVAKHMGLSPSLSKKGEQYLNNEVAPLQIDGDKVEQLDTTTDGHLTSIPHIKKGAKNKLHEHSSAEASGQRKDHGSNIPESQVEPVVIMNNGLNLASNAFKGNVDVQKAPAAAIVTERCQDALRSIISTDKFAALSNILNRGSSSGSLEAPLQIKALPGSIDLQLIHLRLSNGVYGLTPDLFSTDIKQVWKNISAVGSELVGLAQSLSEYSDKIYKQQILSLFQTPAPKDVAESKKSSHFSSQHGKHSLEDDVISLEDSHLVQVNPSEKATVKEANKGSPVQEKRPPTQTYKSKRRQKKVSKSKKPLVLKGRVADDKIRGVCKVCGLEQGMDCVTCRLCKAAFHIRCTGLPPNKLQEGEWGCPSCADESKENSSSSDETIKVLFKSTGITGVCKACKKEDDNVLLCDGCKAAYHMKCITPAIDCVPDESWYCLKCAGNQRSAGKDMDEDLSVPDNHVRIPKASLLPDDFDHEGAEHASAVKGGRPPDESVEHAATAKEVNEPGSPPPDSVDNEVPECRFLLGNENACKACGVESSKSMILCCFCSNRFHLSCLQPPLKRAPRTKWYCPSCLCRVCKIDADDDKILLCDTCDEGYHTYCLIPPLVEKPKGAWFCPSCAKVDDVPNLPLPKQTEVLKRKRKSTEPRRST